MSENPELYYFMNESVSDVIFMIEGQPLPSQKLFLSIKSNVFRAMFSGDFKETKDKEVVIEDTTYEAFKTFIWFLYCDDLDLKDDNDFNLFPELYRLSDRYDVSRLADRLTDILYKKSLTLLESVCTSSLDWPEMQSISKIAFEFKIEKLMKNVIQFIDKKLYYFLTQDNEELLQLNDLTDNRLLTLMFEKCTEDRYQYDVKEKLKGLIDLMAIKYKQLNGSPKKVKSFECNVCGAHNKVD